MAPKFVSWLDLPSGARWLDVGCGTGYLLREIARRHPGVAGIGASVLLLFGDAARIELRRFAPSFRDAMIPA